MRVITDPYILARLEQARAQNETELEIDGVKFSLALITR